MDLAVYFPFIFLFGTSDVSSHGACMHASMHVFWAVFVAVI